MNFFLKKKLDSIAVLYNYSKKKKKSLCGLLLYLIYAKIPCLKKSIKPCQQSSWICLIHMKLATGPSFKPIITGFAKLAFILDKMKIFLLKFFRI